MDLMLQRDTGTRALSLDAVGQNAPIRMAPTKANAIQTTSTFNLIARFADMTSSLLLSRSLSEGRSPPKPENVLRRRRFPSNRKKLLNCSAGRIKSRNFLFSSFALQMMSCAKGAAGRKRPMRHYSLPAAIRYRRRANQRENSVG
jgi:hypothetical protein